MRKRKPKAALTFLSLVLVLNGLVAARGQRTAPPSVGAAPPPAARAETDPAARRRETFEVVWQTVRESHFDPTFGGLDWEAVRREFEPLVARTRTDSELHALLQRMLNRLKQSHFNIVSPEDIPEFVDGSEGADEGAEGAEGEEAGEDDPLQPHKLRLTEHLTHGVGLDLRVVAGQAVVTRVEPDSPAARAGLRPGYILTSVDGRTVRSILRALRAAALYDPSARYQLAARLVVGFLNGPPGSLARVSYLDAANRLRRASVPRERLRGEMSPPLQNLPPQFVEFEARRLRGGVGYIRFNVFAAPVLEKFCEALRTMADAPGLVLDLRGNRGGVLALLYGMGGLLSERPLNLGEMRTREGGWLFNTVPQRRPYSGQLVVLVDGETQSAGEMLAVGLSETGRALLIGERTAGATLPSAVKELPTGALLQYAFADYLTPYGKAVEGKGVEPTVRVRLDRRSLLAGRDPQLEAALDAIAPSVSGARARAPGGGQTIAAAEEEEEKAAAEGAAPAEASGAVRPGARAGEGAALDPVVEEIIRKYEQAVGGRGAFERLSSRVSEGTAEGTFGGSAVGGTFEMYEKAPDRLLTVLRLPEVGRLRRAHTGAHAYEQATLYGFRELRGRELADIRIEADLRWPVRLREHYRRFVYKGTHEADGAVSHVVEAVPPSGSPTTLFFDKQTGLLVSRDGVMIEDYREVDGIRLPFAVRGRQMTIRLTRVRHNVELDEAVFAEEKDCFTR